MIIGHQKNLVFLETAIANKQLSHAWCFAGPAQVGKRLAAFTLASKILRTEPDKLFSHSDFVYIERDVDEKKGTLKKDISIEQAKKAGTFLANRSWLGGTKIVIIDEADAINIEAANALLKTLEESVENSLIILLAVNDLSLPETVRSRCQHLSFGLVGDDEIYDGLRAMGYDEKNARLAASMSWGRPGRAINLLAQEGQMEDLVKETDRLKSLVGAPFHKKIQISEDMFGDKDDHIRGRDHLKDIIDLWVMIWREALRGHDLLGKKMAREKASEIINELQSAKDLLGKNIHPRLIIEKILLKI